MRTSFSPTARAAQRLAAGGTRPSVPSTPPMPVPAAPGARCELWCEWPRVRVQSLPPFRSIRQALQQIQAIQARHA